MQKGKETYMKKQDNESLIQELTRRLDWYMMEASDEEFDADQVQALMKLLDSLKSEEEEKIEEELPVEEAVSNFWKYREEREEEEKILFGAEESKESDGAVRDEEKEEQKESKFRRVLWYFHRHRLAVVTAALLVVIMLGGSLQAVANAEKHGGFFWWMDKNEEGTTMITSPEGVEDEDLINASVESYYSIDEVPEKYREYIEQVCQIQSLSEYEFNYSQIATVSHKERVHILMKGDKDNVQFEIVIYPQEILRVREKYPGYIFKREFEDGGILFDVLSKEEASESNTFLMYFYYGKVKYIIMGNIDEEELQKIAIEYKNIVLMQDENE